MSAPAAKAFSLPVRTTALIQSSSWYSSKAAFMFSIKPLHRAFSAFGRFRVINPTDFSLPTVSVLMNSYCESAEIQK